MMPLLDRLTGFHSLAGKWIDARLPQRVPLSPTYAQVEIINRCNLRCVMCAISELTAARKRKMLDVKGFAAIVEQIPRLQRVDLQGIGEPLLNPHLEEIVSWCTERRIEVAFVTNGLLLDQDRAQRVLRAGPSVMVFSVDSVDPETYARIRPRGDIDSLLENIRFAVETRRRSGLEGTHIGIMAVAMRDSMAGLPAVVRTAASLGVDGLTIKGVNTRPNPEVQADAEERLSGEIEEAIAENPDLAVTVAFANDRSRLRCRWPWTSVYVTAEGDLTPCCNCPDARDESLGNLLETPFADLWNGPHYRSFRKRLRSDMPEICSQCPDY